MCCLCICVYVYVMYALIMRGTSDKDNNSDNKKVCKRARSEDASSNSEELRILDLNLFIIKVTTIHTIKKLRKVTG